MKVILIGPELEENLALRYLHASLVQAGHEAAILDFHEGGQIPALAAEIVALEPEVVGLSMVFTARAREFIELARRLRALGYRGHVTAGGHFATFHAEELLRDGATFDSIIGGEGEEPLAALVENLDNPQSVGGLTWRDADGQVRSTGSRSNPPDLDARPWPTRPAEFHEYLGLPIANVLAGRGCFANCSFCSINAWHRANGGPRFRQRDAACVAEEMAHLYHDRGVRIFNFHDDNFFPPTKAAALVRFGQVQAHLDKHHVGRIGIQIKARPDSVDPDVMERLRQIGLFRVFLGVETAAVAGLRTLRRGVTLRQNTRALDLLGRLDLHACFNLLMFDPYARMEDVRQNVAFMRRQARWPLNFCRVEIYAGTELERRLRAENRLEGNYLGYSYRILDPRVQTAYEIFRAVFTPRNFEAEGLNHQAMKVDYYLHLLRHFYPRRATRPLVRRVKHLVAELNRNSAAILDSICRFADRSATPGNAETVDFTARLAGARAEFDRQMNGRMEAALREIRELADGATPRKGGRWVKAASVAAAALLTAGCGGGGVPGTHMHERAPAPLDPVKPPADHDTHPCEMAPAPLGPPAPADKSPWPPLARHLTSEELAAVQKRIETTYRPAVAQLAEKHLPEADRGDLPEVTVFLAPGGKVLQHVIRWPTGRHPEFQKALDAAVSQWTFPKVKRGGLGTVRLAPEPPPIEQALVNRIEKQIHDVYAVQLHELAVRHLSADRRMRPVAVRLFLDARGNVTRYEIRVDEKKHGAYRQALGALIRTWRFPFVKKPGTCIVLLEPAKALHPKGKPPDIHMFEMVPRPIEPPKPRR